MRTCWFTGGASEHPKTGCTNDGEKLSEATNGKMFWVNCPLCDSTFYYTKEDACIASQGDK